MGSTPSDSSTDPGTLRGVASSPSDQVPAEDQDGITIDAVFQKDSGEKEIPVIHAGPEKFKVIRPLGAGGMGKVYLVHDQDLQRNLALKVFRKGCGADERRFLEEARIMGQLQHPNILPVHELGIAPCKRLYYTMPFLEGQNLRNIIDSLAAREPEVVATYSLTRIMQVFLQVTQAVDYAHRQGIVHRDLKPSNVMLGAHGEVQILDWGLSKSLADTNGEGRKPRSFTQPGHVVGTPAYMAPEQAAGAAVDVRMDIYSLGVMLYEMLTLTRPFDGTTAEIMAAVLRDDPVPPRKMAPGRFIPAELERICLKALHKNPSLRQQTAGRLHDEVQAWLEKEADLSERSRTAELKVQQALQQLEAFARQRGRARWLEARLEEARKASAGGAAPPDTATTRETEARIDAAYDMLGLIGSEVLLSLTEALQSEDSNPAARSLLTKFLRECSEEASRKGDRTHARLFASLAYAYQDTGGLGALEDGSLLRRDTPSADETDP